MSRNIIVGLAVLIVAALAWIVIEQFDDGAELADAQVDAPLTTAEDEGAVVVVDPDAEPETNVEEVVEAATDGSEADTEVVAEATDTAIDEAVDEEVVAAAEDDALSLTEGDDVQELEIVEAETSEDTDTLVETVEVETVEAETVDAGTVDAQAVEVETVETAQADVEAVEGAETQELAIVDDADAVEGTADAEATETAALDAEGLSEDGVETLPTSEEATAALSDEAGEAVAGVAEGTESLFAGTDAEIQEVPVDPGDATSADRPELAELLTADGFDADAVIAYIDESDLAAPAKISLRTVVRTAADDPDLVPTVIDRVRDALNVE